MNSYQKLAKLKEETKFHLMVIKKCLDTKEQEYITTLKILENIEDLFQLYEIK